MYLLAPLPTRTDDPTHRYAYKAKWPQEGQSYRVTLNGVGALTARALNVWA